MFNSYFDITRGYMRVLDFCLRNPNPSPHSRSSRTRLRSQRQDALRLNEHRLRIGGERITHLPGGQKTNGDVTRTILHMFKSGFAKELWRSRISRISAEFGLEDPFYPIFRHFGSGKSMVSLPASWLLAAPRCQAREPRKGCSQGRILGWIQTFFRGELA